MKTLGIDPGSRLLGFGVVSKSGTKLCSHSFGTLKFNTKVEANERLLEIYTGVKELIEKFRPDHVAIEKVFFAKNVVSALKLGQARGAAILAVTEAKIPLFEYSPNAIKQATVGFGHADKEQVARMVTRILGVQEFQSYDASDALAIAICHLHTYTYTSRIQKALEQS
ncbi:MAG: crossover junction endodeoxyribonuclease RuvC [Bdellovibrionota bacterium]